MEQNNSHKQILKSTGIVGGAQIFSIILGIVRTKVVALLLGPTGIGVMGILQATADLVRNATGFGINFSGVKDVAEAAATGDHQRIAKTITIIRRWALGTGILGMLITIALCIPLSKYSFGNEKFALSIAIISVTLFISSISSGQIALMQGLRQIGQVAKATLLGAILSTAITLPLYWWLKMDGIVPGMILITLGFLLISWLFARKIKIEKTVISFSETVKGGWNMARLGFFIVITGFVAAATLYTVKAFIAKKMNIDAVGYFQAAWMISNMYMGIVLNAMLADFFPRLSAINKDNTASNKLINEQMEMALIVGSPMIISLIAFAGIAINVLYSSAFRVAIPVLQWQMAGSFITLFTWPMGVMFLSKNKGIFCIITDTLWCAIYFVLVYFGWDYFEFNMLGIAFLAACVGKLVSVVISTRYLGEFSFSNINIRYISLFGAATLLIMLNVFYLEGYIQYVISAVIMLTSALFSYSRLSKIIDIRAIILNKILKR